MSSNHIGGNISIMASNLKSKAIVADLCERPDMIPKPNPNGELRQKVRVSRFCIKNKIRSEKTDHKYHK